MKLALASLLFAACDAQADGGYPGEALVRLHGTAVGFRSDELADGAAVRWNTQVGADLRAGPLVALPLEATPPSGLSVLVLAPPPNEAYFAFAGEPARIAEGTLFLSNAGELVGEAIGVALIHVDGPMASGSLSAGYVGGTPAPGFHLCDVRATAVLSDAQAYFAARCGDDPQCRYLRLYQLVTNSRDLGAELQFFRGHTVTQAEAAIEKLYRDHGHVVLRRARALLCSESEARDAVQDIFLSLLQRPEQLTGVERITAWLYRITTHHCLNALRNQRGRGRLLGALHASSAAVASRFEHFTQVRLLLARLPDPLGEVAVYSHVDGMTYDEIAAMLGCSRRQVGYLLERVRAIATADEPKSDVGPVWPKEQES